MNLDLEIPGTFGCSGEGLSFLSLSPKSTKTTTLEGLAKPPPKARFPTTQVPKGGAYWMYLRPH